jgi:hypothetical protein
VVQALQELGIGDGDDTTPTSQIVRVLDQQLILRRRIPPIRVN